MKKVGKDKKMKHYKKTVDQEMIDLFHHYKKPEPDHSEPSTDPVVGIASLPTPWLYRIWDINQKFLFLMNNVLVSAPQNSNSSEEFVSMVPNRGIEQEHEKIFPIFMGTKDGSQTLSCVESDGDQPQLKLVEERIMDLYSQAQESKSFTFFNRGASGKETCSFESAAFPGWFISTSPEPNKPLGLSNQGGTEITVFYIEKRE